jgi:sulfate/thiosulfate transport system substrate-binding protein
VRGVLLFRFCHAHATGPCTNHLSQFSMRVVITIVTLTLAGCAPASADATLLNVSFDATRELYRAYDSLFARSWHDSTGRTITIEQSHGGSASQAHAVIDGLQGDVVTLALADDIETLSRAGLVDSAWATRLPRASTPFTSTIVFLVRAGNPKAIHDWPDVIRPGVSVITANPKTSGGARWTYLAAWGATLARRHGDTASARAYVAQLYAHALTLDPSARAATTTFVERGLGDVLVGWESDALRTTHATGGNAFAIVVPSVSILAELPVAVVDKVVDAHGTRAVAMAYLRGLYTAEAQSLAARAFYRPTDAAVATQYASQFPALTRFTIDSVFHGWAAAHAVHFADGGVFDQIAGASK